MRSRYFKISGGISKKWLMVIKEIFALFFLSLTAAVGFAEEIGYDYNHGYAAPCQRFGKKMVGSANQRHSCSAVRYHGDRAARSDSRDARAAPGFYALADGLTALWVGGGSRVWSLVLVGVLGVIAGIFTFIYPGIPPNGSILDIP